MATRASTGEDAAKRALDIIVAATLLVLLSPLLAAAALAVRLSGPGPILFRQARYGRAGQAFQIVKFRTMRDTVACAAAIGDPKDHEARTTAVGHWLRRYCVDELPQLFNVLTGDMSLVGPRAHPVGLHVLGALYEDVVPDYHRRHAVRPGMTGLAQVSGFCGIVDSADHARQRVVHDVLYIGTRSLRLDLALIAYTGWRFLVRGGRGRTAFPIARFLPPATGSQTIADGTTIPASIGKVQDSAFARPAPASAW